jgi:hypothetical protein
VTAECTFGQPSMSDERKATGYSPAKLSKEQVDALLQSAPTEFLASVYIDFLSNQPKNDQTREEFRQLLRSKFEFKLPDAVERFWDLPSVILQRPNDEYISLLIEARDLFTNGYFYSCVAMCGIVGERLIKDLIRGSLVMSIDGSTQRPSEEAFDQLERVDASAFVRFLSQTQLLNEPSRKAAEDLIVLRNQYAHARGKQPRRDALDAIAKLHTLVEGTVSVLRDFEIIDGRFVPRTARL